MEFRLEFAGDVQLHRKLARFANRAADASPAFRAIAELLRQSERHQFDSQGQFASGGWKPLAEATIRSKAAKGLDPRILHATGALERSLTGKGPEHVEVVQPHQLVFWTNVPYAKFHQRGTRRMPQRRPVEIRGRDRQEMVRILQAHLLEEFG